MKIDFVTNYSSELSNLFREAIKDPSNKWYYGNNFFELHYKPVTDTYRTREYVVLDDNNKVIGYFAYDMNTLVNKIDSLSFIKFNKEVSLPRKLMLEQLKKDVICCNIEVIEFTGIRGGYPNEKYERLVKLGYINTSGFHKNYCKLYDGKIHDCSVYYFNVEQLDKMIEICK